MLQAVRSATHHSACQLNCFRSTSYLHPRCWLQKLAEELCETRFNSCLLNLYRTGDDKVGWHSDDESMYGKNSTICSVSLGQSRDFQVREKADKTRKLAWSLGQGDVLAMAGARLATGAWRCAQAVASIVCYSVAVLSAASACKRRRRGAASARIPSTLALQARCRRIGSIRCPSAQTCISRALV